MARRVLLMMCAAMLGSADAFTVARPALSARAVASTASPALLPRAALRSAPPAMGLFGLGWAELGVIGILALFIFGPDKIVPFARDLGKQSVALKEVTDSFVEGMAERDNMTNLKSADPEDPPQLQTAKPKEKEENYVWSVKDSPV